MEHTVAYLSDDIKKEKARADYLETVVQNFANHVWHDVKQILDEKYPRARSIHPEYEDE